MAFKIEVDHEKCIGCGACTAQCPDMFEMKDIEGKNLAVAKKEKVDDSGCAKDAEGICPVQAIKVTEE